MKRFHFTFSGTREELRTSLQGLRSVTDAEDALLLLLEGALEDVPARQVPPSADEVVLALRRAGGSVQGAARALGLARSTLRDLMERQRAQRPRSSTQATTSCP